MSLSGARRRLPDLELTGGHDDGLNAELGAHEVGLEGLTRAAAARHAENEGALILGRSMKFSRTPILSRKASEMPVAPLAALERSLEPSEIVVGGGHDGVLEAAERSQGRVMVDVVSRRMLSRRRCRRASARSAPSLRLASVGNARRGKCRNAPELAERRRTRRALANAALWVGNHAPGCRRGRSRPGTWRRPCRPRVSCWSSEIVFVHALPAGHLARRRRCPCRAGRGGAELVAAAARPTPPTVWERAARGAAAASPRRGARSRVPRRSKRVRAPRIPARRRWSYLVIDPSRTASCDRAKPGRARTTEAVTLVMVIADILS